MKRRFSHRRRSPSLLLAGSVQAQSNQGQSGSPEKGPANAGPSHQPSATATQPESRESAAARARRPRKNGGPATDARQELPRNRTGPGEHGRAERNEGNASLRKARNGRRRRKEGTVSPGGAG